MTYIYKGAKDFIYHNICLARLGDTLEIEGVGIRNISYKNKYWKVTEDIVTDILRECEEFDPSADLDLEVEDFSNVKNIKTSSIRKFLDINEDAIVKLIELGVLKTDEDSCRNYHVGKSNYSQHVIQPWALWQDYELNPWDADIVKRVLRTKDEGNLSVSDARILDYQKIIHLCQERIRQLKG